MATTLQYRATRVAGIDPVDGWTLHAFEEFSDPERLPFDVYIARKGDCDVLLNTSDHNFHPNNERFSWLVRSGFPAGVFQHGGRGPFKDSDIDAALLREASERDAA